jgi:hypothetical protein
VDAHRTRPYRTAYVRIRTKIDVVGSSEQVKKRYDKLTDG